MKVVMMLCTTGNTCSSQISEHCLGKFADEKQILTTKKVFLIRKRPFLILWYHLDSNQGHKDFQSFAVTIGIINYIAYPTIPAKFIFSLSARNAKEYIIKPVVIYSTYLLEFVRH